MTSSLGLRGDRRLQPTVKCYRPRQTTTDASEENNTGLLGGPVIINHTADTR